MRIVFNCSSNDKVGFGHLSRCINLARGLKQLDNSFEIYYNGDYNQIALDRINYYRFNTFQHIPSVNTQTNDLFIYDSYEIEQRDLDLIVHEKPKAIFIDDFNKLDYSKAFAVINYRLNAEILFNYESNHSFLGINYFIIKPELIQLRNNKLNNTNTDFNNYLIFVSGTSNSAEILNNLITKLDSVLRNKNILVLSTTSSFVSNNSNKIVCLPFVNNIEEVLDKTDVLLCGGGGIKYEASFCLIPTFVWSINAEQQADTDVLEHEKLVTDCKKIFFNWNEIADSFYLTEQKEILKTKFKSDSLNKLSESIVSIVNTH